jgi:hypothetical protein
LESLRPAVRSGRIIYRRPHNPEPPPTHGETIWLNGSADKAAEIADIVRNIEKAALPGLPGNPFNG